MENSAMMRDPETAGSRVYVGNLPADVTQSELNAQFARYGTIRGILVNRQYAFVQYVAKTAAALAVQRENGVFVRGQRISVRPAFSNLAPSHPQQPMQQQQSMQHPQQSMQPQQNQKPPPHPNQQQVQMPALNTIESLVQKQQSGQQLSNKQKKRLERLLAFKQRVRAEAEQTADGQQQQQQQQQPPSSDRTAESSPTASGSQSNETSTNQLPAQPQANSAPKDDQQSAPAPLAASSAAPASTPSSSSSSSAAVAVVDLDDDDKQMMDRFHQMQEREQQEQERTAANGATAAAAAAPQPQQPAQQQQQNKPAAAAAQPPPKPLLDPAAPQDLNRTAKPYEPYLTRKQRQQRADGGAWPHDLYDQQQQQQQQQQYGDGDYGGGAPKRFARSGPNGGGPPQSMAGAGGGGGGPPSAWAAMAAQHQHQQQQHAHQYDDHHANWQQHPTGGGGGAPRMQFQQPTLQHPGSEVPAFDGPPVDCEVICTHPALQPYAESVVGRVRNSGLRAELVRQNAPVPVMLAQIAARRTLYAIFVRQFNEVQQTVNVFVVHSGDPNEHRHIPVRDAMEMMRNDMTALADKQQAARMVGGRGGGGGGGAPIGGRGGGGGDIEGRGGGGGGAIPKAVLITPTSQAAAPPLNQRHPAAVQTLLNLIADNRPATVLQYDRVIQYLQERRELQLKAEIGDAPMPASIVAVGGAHEPQPALVDAELELQRKILDIMNKPSITTSAALAAATQAATAAPPPPAPQSEISAAALEALRAVSSSSSSSPAVSSTSAGYGQPASSATGSTLLADPKVQKALDSLLSGSLFNF